MLRLRDLAVDIQASRILRGVTLEVGEREVVCLVGRNGAGKTTTLRSIMGYRQPTRGVIEFRGQSIAGWPTHRIAGLGVGFSPEESEVFGDLTVAENIEIATWVRPSARSAAARVEQAYAVFPQLRPYAARGGTHLSGGERKMLSIARALALDPDLLLLDEPFEGLSPTVIPRIAASIQTIASELGRSILLAESNIHQVPAYATRLYVIERGEIVFGGTPADALADPAVRRLVSGAA
jgi:branched-chain amino acid transport system ATP-binding protein